MLDRSGQIWVWDDALLTGVRKIDEQHKQLFEEANRLAVATIRHEGHKVVGQFLNYIGIYAVEHFQTEEAFIDAYAYPDAVRHKAEHQRFIEEFGELKTNTPETSLVGVLRVCARITQWMNTHIHECDKPLAAYLRVMLWDNELPRTG